MICWKCGAENKDDAYFCSLCQTKFKDPPSKVKENISINEQAFMTTSGVGYAKQAVHKDEEVWAMFCHLSALLGFAIPLGNFIGPLIFWLLRRDKSLFINDHGRESINFQITILLYSVGVFLLTIINNYLAILALILAIYEVVMVIYASVMAYSGNRFHYLLSMNILS